MILKSNIKTTIIIIAIIVITVTVLVLYVFSDIGKSINNYYFPRKNVHHYGEIVYFKKADKLVYPDFTITYEGEKTNTLRIPNNNKITRTVSVDEFIVCTPIDQSIPTNGNCIGVGWSSGLGLVVPFMFEVKGQEYTIIKDIGPMTILSLGGKVSWVIDKVIDPQNDNLVVDESYLLGTWLGSNDVGSGKYIFQKVNGKNVLSGHYSFTAQSSRTPLTDCTWSLGRDQFGRDGFAFTMYCEKISHYQSFDTITKNIAGDKLYLSNKTDKKFGEDLVLTRVVDLKK